MQVTLGSDDPPYFGATIGGEYALCAEHYDFDDEALRAHHPHGNRGRILRANTQTGVNANGVGWRNS